MHRLKESNSGRIPCATCHTPIRPNSDEATVRTVFSDGPYGGYKQTSYTVCVPCGNKDLFEDCD